MSTPLIALAVILAIFAVVLIPLMMVKSDNQGAEVQSRHNGNQGKRAAKKKKRR